MDGAHPISRANPTHPQPLGPQSANLTFYPQVCLPRHHFLLPCHSRLSAAPVGFPQVAGAFRVPGQGSKLADSEGFPKLHLARHGETAWSISGQHTGRVDVPLTDQGERNARSLGARLKGLSFVKVLTSPLQRAKRTSDLAGFGSVATIDPDLVEWNYGQYEDQSTVEIRQERPNWNLFRDGCPAGETLDDVSARSDRVIGHIRACAGDALIFAHQDLLRILAVRWLRLPAIEAQHFVLTTASLSILGYDHGLDQPVIRLWNDDRHMATDAPRVF